MKITIYGCSTKTRRRAVRVCSNSWRAPWKSPRFRRASARLLIVKRVSGVVVAEHPPSAGQDLLMQRKGLAVLASSPQIDRCFVQEP